VPAAADADVEIVSTAVPAPPASVAGENEEVPTDGASPVTDSATSPANPLIDVTPTLDDTPAPAVTLWLDGVTATAKSGGAETTTVTAAVRASEPLVPDTVIG